MTQHKQAAQAALYTSERQGDVIKHRLGNCIFYTDAPPDDEAPDTASVKISRKAYNTIFPNYPDVLDVKQVSELLGVSSKTVYRLLNEGALTSLKVGRAFKIPKLYLLQYITVSNPTLLET